MKPAPPRRHGVLRTLLAAVLLLTAVSLLAGWLLLRDGLSARGEPSALEAKIAHRLRHLSVPRSYREARNPVPATTQALDEARERFAADCASCHGADGRGGTTIGRHLYPRVPDLWDHESQEMSDGELFWVIKHGIRFSGMPAWGDDTESDDRENWKLVHLIRQMPRPGSPAASPTPPHEH